MELAEVLARRHMVRDFSGAPVAPETLARVLGAAMAAPSAGNAGGWEAVVLEGPSETGLFWEATTTADWRARARRWAGLSLAPVVVALFADPQAYLLRYGEPDKAASGLHSGPEAWPVPYWLLDTGFAALLLMLGAVDAGLGACFLGNFRGDEALRRTLGVPDGRPYVGAVLIGEPAGAEVPSESQARGRRAVDGAFHRGRW